MTDHSPSPVLTLTCAAPGCTRWQTCQAEHVPNLTAAGPYLCPDHRDAEPQEVPC